MRLGFHEKKIFLHFFHKIFNKIKGCLSKSNKWLRSYAQQTILGPFPPNIQTRSQSPCQTKFSKKNLSSVDHKILNKMRG